jgi:predicted nucleic acid-binding protein
MNLYVDSSVLLRIVLGEARPLREWKKAERFVSSELVRAECLRTVDRARLRFALSEAEVSSRRADILRRLDTFDLIPLHRSILERAADPFPTLVGTLDAVHLASALAVRERYRDLTFATHDDDLAIAARAEGFVVVGRDRESLRRKRGTR